MKYIEEFQTKEAVLPLLQQLEEEVNPHKKYRFMEFCGGHTHSLFKSGLIDLLPEQIEMVHGPGCPVCVLPSFPISNVIELMENDSSIMLSTYADLMRVPTEEGDSLLKAKSRGLSIFPIYSPLEALNVAKENPEKKMIFLAIGFETTIPATVAILDQVIKEKISNFFIYCNHLNTTLALESILTSEGGKKLDGLVGPGHVSLVTGSDFFKDHADRFQKPIVISGFTPYDLAKSILLLVEQVNKGEAQVEVEYSRAVTREGNTSSQKLMNQYLELREIFEWRGLGELKKSAFKLKKQYQDFDAKVVFDLKTMEVFDHPQCLCPKVLMGEANPLDCKLYGKACTPHSPYGPCMVSSEGACSAYFAAGKSHE